jgi:uncharacterized membrane protein YqjE
MVQTEPARPAASPAEPSLGELVATATQDLAKLVKGEMDLAKLELKADMKRLGVAGGMYGFSAYMGALVTVMLCFALAYGLIALHIWPWAAFLIVAGALVLLIGGAAGFGTLKMRRISGLKRTRETVHEDLQLLQREDEAAGTPAIEAR